ncbi:S-layer homology domain-containing protein [Paraclostridium sordellii]|uniref:S-layer homology domain-containing protein n=1 Tax=Paraclostridium sordellii TaxID=1505 RepID=UPI0005EA544A|nr:S-layer homology domain-containing protein [Paeniclostridium sordellii]CEQ18317.1 glucan endo-1 [[Clostridium] sordellii] [Paeniclostridium sordellii]
MNKKLISLVVSSLLVFTNVSYIHNVYAEENTKSNQTKNSQSKNSKNIVYLSDGEGSLSLGDGTQQSPYQNIRTALNNISDGGTLKLLGTVKYTKYDSHTDGSALPLFINKNITIESGNNTYPVSSNADELSLRTPIQLGANVTFKNINLKMIPEVVLGKGSNIPNTKILGVKNPKSATIFTAGNKLTLDNVNTKIGYSQDEDRPYISGGSFKNQGKIGSKSIINVINPNSETKLSGIYAGDYWEERNLDVEINLSGNVLEKTIHTGGLLKPLNGRVDISLGSKGTINSFDKTNHNGSVNLNLGKDRYTENLNLDGINNLSLEDNAKLILQKGSKFNVNNITLKNNSVVDFRFMSENPIVNGSFQGEDITTSTIQGGCILLKDNRTLDVKGEVLGTTRLNYNGTALYVEPLKENHEYIRAKVNSRGDFTIKQDLSKRFILKKNLNNNNKTTWTYTINNGDSSTPIKNEKPVITANNVTIKARKQIDLLNDNRIGLKATDKEDGNIKGRVTIKNTGGLNSSNPSKGVYTVVYTVKDNHGNIVDKSIQVNVLSNDAPVINGLKDKTIHLKEVDEFNKTGKLDGVTVIDDHDKISPSSITVKGVVGKPGTGTNQTHNITYTVNDSDGNVTTKVIKVTVTNQLPTISGISELTIKLGDKFKPLSLVSSNDKEDGNITPKVIVKENTVDTKKAGVYKVVYSVTDSDKNTVIKEIKVIVKSNINIIDIKGHWAESQINSFVSSGHINGYGDGTFKPDNSITRAEFIKIFNKYFGLSKTSGKVFNDTKTHWAKIEIDIAVTNGVANGVSLTEFQPDEPITREQAAKMISNYKKLDDTNHDKVAKYKDMNQVSNWALNSVEGIIELGYMNGYEDNTFRPKNNITRAEAVVTLSRIK